jgi:hypothetical protein
MTGPNHVPGGEDVLTADVAHLGVEWTTPMEVDDPLAAPD